MADSSTLCSLVEQYLSLHLHSNALFLAERVRTLPRCCIDCGGISNVTLAVFVVVWQLFASSPSEVNRHLLSCCLLYSGEKGRALAVLRDSVAPTNRYRMTTVSWFASVVSFYGRSRLLRRYLYARYCYDAKQYLEAEQALLKDVVIKVCVGVAAFASAMQRFNWSSVPHPLGFAVP
jgi:hypothetical protein